MQMTNWKPIAIAPKTGTRVLLWAQCKSIPRDGVYSPIVGYWTNQPTEQWKVAPEHLNREEEFMPQLVGIFQASQVLERHRKGLALGKHRGAKTREPRACFVATASICAAFLALGVKRL